VKWAAAAGAVLVLAAAWLMLRPGPPPPSRDRGTPGITFVIPDDAAVLDLGESTLAAAARALLDTLGGGAPAAAVFTHSGDRIQLLIDGNRDMIDERVAGREGVVRRVLWRGSVRQRLLWAEAHGDLAAPGLPPPERRNPYH
jgi:hypothetical protein